MCVCLHMDKVMSESDFPPPCSHLTEEPLTMPSPLLLRNIHTSTHTHTNTQAHTHTHTHTHFSLAQSWEGNQTCHLLYLPLKVRAPGLGSTVISVMEMRGDRTGKPESPFSTQHTQTRTHTHTHTHSYTHRLVHTQAWLSRF